LSAVASDDAVDRVEHLVEYLSCRVFGQAMYRHVILNLNILIYWLREIRVKLLSYIKILLINPILLALILIRT